MQRGVAIEECDLELLQPRARVKPELLRQRLPEVLVDLQRFRLAVRAVQREHELRPHPLPKRVSLHQRGQLANNVALAPERKIRVDALLQGAQMQILELRDRRLREGLVGKVGQRRPTPQSQPVAQDRGSPPGVACRQRLAPLLDRSPEAVEVKLAGRDAKQVPVPASDQHPVFPAGGPIAVVSK